MGMCVLLFFHWSSMFLQRNWAPKIKVYEDGNVSEWKQCCLDCEMESLVCDAKVNHGESCISFPTPQSTKISLKSTLTISTFGMLLAARIHPRSS